MKSETSFFNRTLFFGLLKRYWPIFAAYFIIWLILMPVALANMLQYTGQSIDSAMPLSYYQASIGYTILQLGLYGGAILSGIFSVFIAMAAFSYLYNPRHVSMVCALPIRREGVFLSVFSAGLAGLLSINVIIFLLSLLVEAAFGSFAFGVGYLLQWLAMVSLMALFFYGFATLCASLTGHILVLPVVYVVLNFTAYVVEYLVKAAANIFIYGLSGSRDLHFTVLSPYVKLILSHMDAVQADSASGVSTYAVAYQYDSWSLLIGYALAGLALALAAMLIIRRRRMETAGDVVSLKPLKPVFKYCLAFGCALVLGTGIYSIAFSYSNTLYGMESMLFLLLFMLIFAFIGYFAAEMLLQKTLRVFKGRQWTGFLITAVCIIGLMVGTELDVFGIEKKVPNAKEIQGVSISGSNDNVLFEEPDNIAAVRQLHSDIVAHKAQNEPFLSKSNPGEWSSCYIMLTYTYKDGSVLERSYSLYQDANDDIKTLNALLNTKEAVDYRKKLSVAATPETITDSYISYFDPDSSEYQTLALTPDEAYHLYNECILPDIDDGTLGKIWLTPDDTYYNSVYDCTVSFSLVTQLGEDNYESDYFYTTLTVNAQRTLSWVREHGITPVTMGQSRDATKDKSGAYAEKAGVMPVQ